MNGQQPYHQNVGSIGSQNDTYNWQRHAHTVPQTNRGGRRLPQTPNVPSTLNPSLSALVNSQRSHLNGLTPKCTLFTCFTK